MDSGEADTPVPVGTTENSPAIHCREMGHPISYSPVGTTETFSVEEMDEYIDFLKKHCIAYDEYSAIPTGLCFYVRDLSPAMNCRAILCRPCRDYGIDLPKIRYNQQISFRLKQVSKSAISKKIKRDRFSNG
jgi:hypothetical protein